MMHSWQPLLNEVDEVPLVPPCPKLNVCRNLGSQDTILSEESSLFGWVSKTGSKKAISEEQNVEPTAAWLDRLLSFWLSNEFFVLISSWCFAYIMFHTSVNFPFLDTTLYSQRFYVYQLGYFGIGFIFSLVFGNLYRPSITRYLIEKKFLKNNQSRKQLTISFFCFVWYLLIEIFLSFGMMMLILSSLKKFIRIYT